MFQTFHSENCSVFLQNLPILSLRGGHFQCPTRQSETGRNGIPERDTAKPVRCRLATNQNFGITSFCAPVLRHGMPYLWLKDCHVATLLAMTQNRGIFVQNGCFALYAGIFCVVLLHIVFQTFRPENRSVFPRNLPILSLRGGHFQCPTRQSETGRNGIPERTTREGGKAAVGCITISRKNRRSDGTAVILEVPPRFELGSQGFADPCLTTWPRHRI